jgi:hypothetical protein
VIGHLVRHPVSVDGNLVFGSATMGSRCGQVEWVSGPSVFEAFRRGTTAIVITRPHSIAPVTRHCIQRSRTL